ncbi:MAG TPA: T9SS type A sorting domain-containing protein [Saprospiraceae bacterium]|nr:T9SS type A sorting domain-containing protein [Saprospiraceae bacterium]
MKKSLFTILAICFLRPTFAQQFSFQMYFSDAIGDKDTITLGYDLLATEGIDTAFGEENIISIPPKTSLDVRITNEWYNRYFNKLPGTIHLKKQIVFYNCIMFPWPSKQAIDINTKHWPVIVSWDSTLFNDSCRNGSVFTSINPGGWWDTGSPSNLYLRELALFDNATFSSNVQGQLNEGYGYKNSYGDTIPFFWQAFGDSNLLKSAVEQFPDINNSINVFPNPSNDFISISFDAFFGQIKQVELYNSIGQLVLSPKAEDQIDITTLRSGFYFIKLITDKGFKAIAKVIKLE